MESCLIFSKSFNSDPDLVSINAFPCNQYMKSDLSHWLSQFQERILRTQTGGIQGLGVGLSVYDHIVPLSSLLPGVWFPNITHSDFGLTPLLVIKTTVPDFLHYCPSVWVLKLQG